MDSAFPCPNCGTLTLPGARFCHNCGYPLGSHPTISKTQSTPAEGERRVVTMLFCDVKGSTSLAESLDPEEWTEIMNKAFEYLIPPVYRYEGMVVRLMGDALLAFFGAPVAHEDDPQRAVRAGLEIVEGIRSYKDQLRQERGLDFDVRVGINTGLVVVGDVGGGGRLEYSAMGDAINLAARMEQTAAPGSVQVSEATFRLVEPYFEAESLGEIEVKGKREPVRAYRITSLKAEPDRPSGIHGRSAPLIGRQAEMIILRRATQKARAGKGQLVCMIGEAGLGKTRLIEELRLEWQAAEPNEQVYLGEVRGVSYGALRPYEQYRQHLQAMTGIRETDSPTEVRAKLERMLAFASQELRDRAMSVYPIFFNAHTEKVSERGEPVLEGEAFKRELFDVVLRLIAEMAGRRTRMLAIEDLHWIDTASVELVEHLFQLVRIAPVLLVCTFRPEHETLAWRLRETAARDYADCYTEIILQPLTNAEGEALIDHLLPGGRASLGERQDLIARILEKAEGNPLFIEEVVHDLLDNHLSYSGEDFPVPGSLQALLLARLDHLEEGPRHMLQLAAVIGRTFSHQVLRQLIPTSPNFEADLQALLGAGLVREADHQPELQYTFHHALTHEVAYGSILLKRRRELHAQVGETLEALYPGLPEAQAAQLAHHFEAAGDPRARRYHRIAGEQAQRLYANEEALYHFTRALELDPPDPPGAAADETIRLYRARARLYFFLGRLSDASADLQEAVKITRQAGLEAEETRVLAELALISWMRGQGSESLELAQKAEAKAQAIGDPALSLHAALILATAIQNEGEIPAAHTRTRQALLTSRRHKDRFMEATCLHYLAMQNNFMGRFGRAAVCARKSIDEYLHVGEKGLAINSFFFLSLAEGGRGSYDCALEALEDGRSLAEEISSPWQSRYYNQRAWLHAELGDWETAFAHDLAGLEPSRLRPGFREIEISTQINLALDCLALGRTTEAEDYLAESEQNLGRPEFATHNWRWRTRLVDARARFFLLRGRLPEASGAVEDLLSWAAHTRARKYTARGLLLRAQIAQAGANLPSLAEDLHASMQMADQIKYLPVQIEARRALCRLYTHQHAPAKVALFKGEIEQALDVLDSRIIHPVLRHSFERGLAIKAMDNL